MGMIIFGAIVLWLFFGYMSYKKAQDIGEYDL